MLTYNFRAVLKYCSALLFSVTLLCNIESIAFAVSVETHRLVTVPFTGTQADPEYRPHQLIIVGIRANTSSPLTYGTFLFDTGTSGSFVSASFAQKLNIPQHQTVNVRINHSSISEVHESTKPATLEMGGLHIQDPIFYILPDQELVVGPGQMVDGILGADLWSSFAVHIDFAHDQIIFTVPMAETLSRNSLGQNPITLSPAEIALQGFETALNIPMVEYDGSFFASVVLRNGSSTTTDSLVIDSGSDVTFLSQQATQKLSLQTISQQTSTIFPNVQEATDLAWLPSFISGGLKLDNILVRSSPKSQPAPNLGLDVLANYDVLFDFPHRKMFLKPRSDIHVVTARQYEVASPAQRRQWAQAKLIVTYPTPTLDAGLAIPYDTTSSGLPLTQVWPDKAITSTPFLLSSDMKNSFISDDLAERWLTKPQAVLDSAGKPRLIMGRVIRTATVSKLHIAGALGKIKLGVLSADGLFHYTSYLSLQGVVGANFLFARSLLMDPVSQTWMLLTSFHPEDLPGLGMADATTIDILDPDGDGIPAIAVREQQSAVQFTDTMTLATGSPFTLLSAEAAKTLKLTPETAKLRYGAGKDIMVFNRAHLSQLSIGGVVLKDVEVAYPIGAMPDGFYPRLGMNVISKLRLLVDAPAKKMYVKTAGK